VSDRVKGYIERERMIECVREREGEKEKEREREREKKEREKGERERDLGRQMVGERDRGKE
jgi:hypothetical protein